ncbi:Hypothetical predicted protein [Podarcis lilfordi]|uniref:Uncharacterized protein n=1 Tax=Podarcis lilfordi TaxID=74358 RepID=A0AA35KGI1_9SAUR|nr:Hypothetical predicted protein [Podarcis lilfordi]
MVLTDVLLHLAFVTTQTELLNFGPAIKGINQPQRGWGRNSHFACSKIQIKKEYVCVSLLFEGGLSAPKMVLYKEIIFDDCLSASLGYRVLKLVSREFKHGKTFADNL